MSGVLTILGVDPGLVRTGWGVIEVQGNAFRYIHAGVVAVPTGDALAARLKAIHDGLAEVIARYKPQEAAIEETFVNTNAASTLKLGHARGAAMLALSIHGLDVAEYAALLVKKTVVGAGRAEKHQVAHMVSRLLPGVGQMKADATDALAVAITHAVHLPLRNRT